MGYLSKLAGFGDAAKPRDGGQLDTRFGAVLSGYQSELYAPLEAAGWTRHDFATACFAAGTTRASGLQGKGAALAKVPRVESVWVKPQPP